jgi:hypothetical protein
MMVGDMAFTWWKHNASQKALSVKKYLYWDNETWSEPVLDTYKHIEKIAGGSHFQGHCN